MIKLGPANEFKEGQSKGYDLGVMKIFVVKKQGLLYAYENRCPHLGIPLEWIPDEFLDSEGELIQCSTHGAIFLIETGECVSGPCAGDYLIHRTLIERDGDIYLEG